MSGLNFLSPSVARERLARKLSEQGIHNPQVLEAVRTVPRHLFVDGGFSHRAYEDTTLPIDQNQTISQPYIVALMTQLLDIQPNMKVLEIGTGSGYQTAILSQFTKRLFTIERIKELSFKARKLFDQLNLKNVVAKYGDGTQGWEAYAPFDRIIVTAGAPVVPQALLNQLAPEGKLLIPTGEREQQRLELYHHRTTRIERQLFNDVLFVPLIGREGWRDAEDGLNEQS